MVQRRQPGRAGQVGEPAAVFLGGVLADAADVAVHGKAQRIGIDAAVGAVAGGRLVDHVGVGGQPFDHHAVGQPAFVVQGVEQGVVPERGPALVHHLGLALRIEVLGDLAHDAHDLALPRLQQRGVLLDEVQQVFLGFLGKALAVLRRAVLARAGRQGAPQLVDLLLGIGLALLALGPLARQAFLGGAAVTVHAQVGQRVAGVQPLLHRRQAMALLALGDEVARIDQVVDDAARIRPHAEQVVVLEEAVVAVRRMGDHQGLHGGGVLLHQIADAGIGVDDDLVGQAHVAAPVAPLRRHVFLAIAPVAVAHGHAHAGVGVHHLLGRDHFQLVGIGVQAVALCRGRNRCVIAFDELEGPVAGIGQRLGRPRPRRQRRGGHDALGPFAGQMGFPLRRGMAGRQHGIVREVHTDTPSFLNRSRNTG